METLLPIRRRASQHPRRANRSPRGTRRSCTVTARPCAARQKAATTPLTNHKKNPQPRFNRNQQYSITALTDGGSIVERYAYTAYGQATILDTSLSQLATSAVGNRYTYTGREWDDGLDLYHYRARMYDAVAGRLISRDPIGYGDGKNLHQFLRSSPLRGADPSGTIRIWPSVSSGLGIYLPCVTTSRQSWVIELEQDAPCDGFIVQLVTVNCAINACRGNRSRPQSIQYWESWFVKAGEREPRQLDSDPATGEAFADTADYTPPNRTKGGILRMVSFGSAVRRKMQTARLIRMGFRPPRSR